MSAKPYWPTLKPLGLGFGSLELARWRNGLACWPGYQHGPGSMSHLEEFCSCNKVSLLTQSNPNANICGTIRKNMLAVIILPYYNKKKYVGTSPWTLGQYHDVALAHRRDSTKTHLIMLSYFGYYYGMVLPY